MNCIFITIYDPSGKYCFRIRTCNGVFFLLRHCYVYCLSTIGADRFLRSCSDSVASHANTQLMM